MLNRAGVFHSGFKAGFCFLKPSSIYWVEALRFGEDLRRCKTRRVQFVFRKVTSACPKIGPGVAQHIDQLKRHAVPSAESKHFILGAVRVITPAKIGSKDKTNVTPSAEVTSATIAIYGRG